MGVIDAATQGNIGGEGVRAEQGAERLVDALAAFVAGCTERDNVMLAEAADSLDEGRAMMVEIRVDAHVATG
jgi:hypothetical protein